MNKRIQQIEAHDAGGYETDMMEFSELDDGYGNNIAHGDLSVQRLVERGVRQGNWPACAAQNSRSTDEEGPVREGNVERYDKEFWAAAIPIAMSLLGGMMQGKKGGGGGSDAASLYSSQAGPTGGARIPGMIKEDY